jgi:hypothetical protein
LLKDCVMPGIQETLDDMELPSLADRDDEEPAVGEDDREHRVARRLNPLPAREEDEEELAEADLLHELDLDEDDIDLDAFDADEPDQ